MTKDIINELKMPFAKPLVSWRVQGKAYKKNGVYSAKALAYIDARDVMNRFDDVVGAENWQVTYHDAGKRIFATISIKINGEWISKTDGAGDTAVEAEKGAISDALKRAAVLWGVGRYLYSLDAPYVKCEVNDKEAWKAWIEDPWTKVKYENALETAGFANAAARNDSFNLLMHCLNNCADENEYAALMEVAHPLLNRVKKTERMIADNLNGRIATLEDYFKNVAEEMQIEADYK